MLLMLIKKRSGPSVYCHVEPLTLLATYWIDGCLLTLSDIYYSNKI